jgi:biopolymer transport protein ExbD
VKSKKTFLKKSVTSDQLSLQITSMADIFMILLVFLLKTYAVGAMEVVPSKGVYIPQATAQTAIIEALKVELSERTVLVEGEPVASVIKFRFLKDDLTASGISKSLSAAFEKERKRQEFIAKNNPKVKPDFKIIIVADKRAPYVTVKSVLASAAAHGYTEFKLAVVNAI